MLPFNDFVRTLLSGAQAAGQQASTPIPSPVAPQPQPQPMPQPTPAPLPAPQAGPPPAAIQQLARRAMAVMDPAQFAQSLGMTPEPATPPTRGFAQPAPGNASDYTGDWVIVDAGAGTVGTNLTNSTERKLIVMPTANAANVPEEAVLGRISNDPEKVKKAEQQGLLLSQQDQETQLVFQTQAQRDNNLYLKKGPQLARETPGTGKAAPPMPTSEEDLRAMQSAPTEALPSQPPNALGQTPDQVFKGQAEFDQLQQDLKTKPRDVVVREQGGAEHDVSDLTTDQLRKTDAGKAALLENNGIFRVGTGEMVIRDAQGRVRKVPYQGEDQPVPADWEVITYGGKEQDPSTIRDERRGGIRVPVVSDLIGAATGGSGDIPFTDRLPNGLIDLYNVPSGLASEGLKLLGGVQQANVSYTADEWMKNPHLAEVYRQEHPDPKTAYSYGGAAPFEVWMAYNYETAQGAYKDGYTDPKTGETFTGGRAVWERFQADRAMWERALDVTATDPLNAVPGGKIGDAVEGVGKIAGRVPGIGRVVGPVIEESARFVDDVGRELDVGASRVVGGVKGGLGKVIRPTEGTRVAVGDGARPAERVYEPSRSQPINEDGSIPRGETVTGPRDTLNPGRNVLPDQAVPPVGPVAAPVSGAPESPVGRQARRQREIDLRTERGPVVRVGAQGEIIRAGDVGAYTPPARDAGARTGERQTSAVIDDLLGQKRQERRDVTAELPVAAPDLTQPGSRSVDLGNGNVARAGYGENPAWTVYGPDGARIVERGSWDDVIQSEPYQQALRDRGVDPRDVGVTRDDRPVTPDPAPATRDRAPEPITTAPSVQPTVDHNAPITSDVTPSGNTIEQRVESVQTPTGSTKDTQIWKIGDYVEITDQTQNPNRPWFNVYDTTGKVGRVASADSLDEAIREADSFIISGETQNNRVARGQVEPHLPPTSNAATVQPTVDHNTPITNDTVPEVKLGADRTPEPITPDAMPAAQTTAVSELQRELRQRLEHTEYLRPQTAGERAAQGRSMRATDRVLELADQYPDRATAFVDEYTPRAERATQRNIERRGRGQWVENTPGTQDGFAIKKALNRVEDAEHYVDDILPLHGRHFGDIEPAPDYVWETKPAKTDSAYRRNLKNQSPDQLLERYIFDEREVHAGAARQVLEDKFIYERDANGQVRIGADGQKIPKSANAALLKRTLDRASEVRERYITSRIASDENAIRAVETPAAVPEAVTPRQQLGGVTTGQREVLAGTGANQRRPLREPRRLGSTAPVRDTTVASLPGVDRGVAPATTLDSPTNDFYWRNAVVSDTQSGVLKQTFTDGERLGDRFNRYVDEVLAEKPKQQEKRLNAGKTPTIAESATTPPVAITTGQAEEIARDRVLAEWGYENLSEKGKARADEWYAKLRKSTNEDAAREQAVRRAMSAESNHRLIRMYDRAARTLRGTILYNVLSAPRTILQQTVGNSLTMALAKQPEVMKAALTPGAVKEAYTKIRAGSSDDLITEMDRARGSWGLKGRREEISGSIATRDQVDVSIDAQYNRRTREARTKLGWQDFNVFSNRAVRDMAGAQDLVAREALWTSFMDRITLDGRANLRERMLARKPNSVSTAEFDALFDALPTRFSADDLRDTFGVHGQTWADRGARDWQELLVKGDRSAAAEVKRLLFDGSMTNADDVARRFVFFHYWMSRAMPMYTAMIARDPVYLLNYSRMMEAMEKENESSSLVDKGFISWMKSPFGYATAIRPDVFFPTFKDAWDNAGYEPDGENSLGKLMRKVGFMPHPIFGTALNMLGMMGDTFAPDPTGTGRLRRLAVEGVDYYKTLTGSGDATPTRDPTNDLLLKGRDWITRNLDWVPGVDAVPYRDSMVYTEREITNIMVDIAKERGLDIESDSFIAAVEDPNSELRRQAFDRWSKQNALDVGLSLSPVGVFYPKSTLISPKLRNESATNMREQRAATDAYPKALPAEQALYDENEIANTPDPQARELKGLQNEYQSLGSARGRAGIAYYNSIRFGHTEEVIAAGGYEWTPVQIKGFDESEREVLADLWAEEAGYADDIAAVQDERKAFREANPDYADYVSWAGDVRDYEGGMERYWEATAGVNPNAGRWYAENKDNPKVMLDGVDAYLAYRGIASNYRDPQPTAVRDPSAIPADAYDLTGGKADAKSKTGDKPKGPTKEGIQKGIAEYQQRRTEYMDLIEQLWGQRVDPELMDPNTRSAVVTILRDNYGVEAPYVSGQTKGYLEWAAAQEGPSGIDDYLTWYERTQKANPAPTGSDIESVTPEDAASVLAH